MDVESSLKKLFSLHNFGVKLGLENTINFLEHIGNPQQRLKAIHVAGSNGKGSTSSFIASILHESGHKTGLYTSPHFVRFNERVQINGELVSDEYIADFISDHENYIDRHELTFFEVTTALAFKYFSQNDVDYCVIETGLGGRLDATNVLNPLAAVITTISLEHTNVLGSDLEKIAFEKAEIIKAGSKVFTGILIPEAEIVVSEKCKQTNCELFRLKDFINDGKKFSVRADKGLIELDDIPLKGNYQKLNAALAALVITKMFGENTQEKITDGIINVIANTNIQGRYEYWQRSPAIIFDSAHNPEGVENFIDEFKQEACRGKKVLLFGVMKDKSIREMLSALAPVFDEIVLTQIDYERSAKLEDLKSICRDLGIIDSMTKDSAGFVKSFVERDKDDCLVVLGSMYLLGEIKSKLLVNVT